MDDMVWASYRLVDTKAKTYYNPHVKVLLDVDFVALTLQSEYFTVKAFSFIEEIQECALSEQEQVLMRAIACLASGT